MAQKNIKKIFFFFEEAPLFSLFRVVASTMGHLVALKYGR
jgi:hypothetical protein